MHGVPEKNTDLAGSCDLNLALAESLPKCSSIFQFKIGTLFLDMVLLEEKYQC